MSGWEESELASAIDAARTAWPSVEVSRDVFARWLSERLKPGQPLSALKTSDLYLACACASSDERALRYFDEQMLAAAESALGRLAMSRTTIDETKQVLRRRFFVGEDGTPPRITEYSGRGDLRSWVRSAAVRAALRVVRRPKGQVDVDSSVMRAVAAPVEDLELEYLKRRYTSEFEEALRAAFAALPTRDRNVLRYYYAQHLSIDAIGTLYRVHRATAARWVRQSVDTLVDETRLMMTTRLGASRTEVSSIVRMIQSRLDTALQAVLIEKTT